MIFLICLTWPFKCHCKSLFFLVLSEICLVIQIMNGLGLSDSSSSPVPALSSSFWVKKQALWVWVRFCWGCFGCLWCFLPIKVSGCFPLKPQSVFSNKKGHRPWSIRGIYLSSSWPGPWQKRPPRYPCKHRRPYGPTCLDNPGQDRGQVKVMATTEYKRDGIGVVFSLVPLCPSRILLYCIILLK